MRDAAPAALTEPPKERKMSYKKNGFQTTQIIGGGATTNIEGRPMQNKKNDEETKNKESDQESEP